MIENIGIVLEKKIENRITKLLEIDLPIIQGGMIWTSGWELASAVSNAGGLGTIGAGSMYPEILEEHILKCKAHTNKPFAVNLPLLYPDIDKHISLIIKHKIPIVITSAGNPMKYTSIFKKEGIKVIHVIANLKFAKKCEEAGVDAIIAEGFEAGGHNGKEETTTMCLIPMIKDNCTLPLIAAGGIYDARGMLATMILGAEGIQMGTRFASTKEASCHQNFKQAIIDAKEGDTKLGLKKLTPVRLLKNEFSEKILSLEENGESKEKILDFLGKARAKKGMFLGDMDNGELEIGQISALVNEIPSTKELIDGIWTNFKKIVENIKN